MFGRVGESKSEALCRVAYWDDQEDHVLPLSEEVLWRQKSREIWLKEGEGILNLFIG